jgi:hypothetical protein
MHMFDEPMRMWKEDDQSERIPWEISHMFNFRYVDVEDDLKSTHQQGLGRPKKLQINLQRSNNVV